MSQIEDPRDQIATAIISAMVAETGVDKVFAESANNGGPMVRLVMSDGAVIHITITRGRS